MTLLADPVRWFHALGACGKCGKAATGTLMGPRNESYGNYCERCAKARLKAAHKERDREASAAASGMLRDKANAK